MAAASGAGTVGKDFRAVPTHGARRRGLPTVLATVLATMFRNPGKKVLR